MPEHDFEKVEKVLDKGLMKGKLWFSTLEDRF